MAYSEGTNKRGKVHWTMYERGTESNPYDEWYSTICGMEYTESPVSNEWDSVTCKRCLLHRPVEQGVASIKKLIEQSDNIIKPDDTQWLIFNRIYEVIEILGGGPDILSIIGSIGDTLTDQEVLWQLNEYVEQNKLTRK